MSPIQRTLAIATILLVAAAPATAETLYVTDRLPIALRAAFTEDGPVVKNIDSGAALEVLERVDRFVKVRDGQGVEGWIEARFLTNAPAARSQLDRAQSELAKTRKDLADAQERVKQLQATLAQESARGAEPPPGATEPGKPPAAAEATTPKAVAAGSSSADDYDFSWGWLVLAFAMLWIGFAAGVVWLRERHRKKLGGMYLRI